MICVSTNSYSQFIDQSIMGTAGETFSNGSAIIDFTIGEVVIDTYNASNLRLTQGFHQSVLNVTEVVEIGAESEIDVFPNPAQEYIQIQFHGHAETRKVAEIYDMVGKKVLEKNIAPNEMMKRIDLDHIKSGQYILIISSDVEGVLNSYKILKLN